LLSASSSSTVESARSGVLAGLRDQAKGLPIFRTILLGHGAARSGALDLLEPFCDRHVAYLTARIQGHERQGLEGLVIHLIVRGRLYFLTIGAGSFSKLCQLSFNLKGAKLDLRRDLDRAKVRNSGRSGLREI
jgi:hypothetical protein